MGAALLLQAGPMLATQGPADFLPKANELYQEGKFQDAARLFGYVLNPAFELPDSIWAVALQRLAHSLLESGREDLAGVWLRWTLRHRGPIPVDDVNYPPSLIRAFAEASRAVEASAVRDTLKMVITSWRWPDQPQELLVLGGVVAESPESLLSEHRCSGAQLSLRLGQLATLGRLPSGQVRYLPPETYRVARTGATCREEWLEREVLPGVVTELTRAAQLTVTSTTTVLLVALDAWLIGSTELSTRRSPRLAVDGRILVPVKGFPVPPGTHRLQVYEVLDQGTRGVWLDTTVSLAPAQHLRINVSGRAPGPPGEMRGPTPGGGRSGSAPGPPAQPTPWLPPQGLAGRQGGR